MRAGGLCTYAIPATLGRAWGGFLGIVGGMDRGARVGVATAHRPEDLDAWKLAAELRERVLGWSQQLGPENAFLKSQIVRSVVSPPANLAEGFGHFKPRQFAKFARIARASSSKRVTTFDSPWLAQP
jgi:hypothetical protein